MSVAKTITFGDITMRRDETGFVTFASVDGVAGSGLRHAIFDEIDRLQTQLAFVKDSTNWQARCLKLGFKYTRAPDDHYVECTQEQAADLLREVLGVDVHFYQEHDLYDDGDIDAPQSIKDRDGRIALGLCRRCGQGEGELAPHCPGPNTAYVQEEINRLRQFKAYVHSRLDEAGVPHDPPSPHREAGCRIGGRLDIVLGTDKPVDPRIVRAFMEIADRMGISTRNRVKHALGVPRE